MVLHSVVQEAACLHGRAMVGWSTCSSSSLLGGVAHTAWRLPVRTAASGTARLVQSVDSVPGVRSAACAAACAAASGSCVQPSLVISSVGGCAVAGLCMKELRGESWPVGLALIFARARTDECTIAVPLRGEKPTTLISKS